MGIDIGMQASDKRSNLHERVKFLENQIRAIASAPTELERVARIEIAIAEVEGRVPEHWATEYLDYACNQKGQFF